MTEQIKDGGPAFHDGHQYGYFTWRFGGVTVRDFFAAAALPQVISTCANDTRGPDESHEDYFSRKSFAIADAMLKAREVGRD